MIETDNVVTAIRSAADKCPGIRCRGCGHGRFRVAYTRRRGDTMVRVRECRKCKRRIKTVEKER